MMKIDVSSKCKQTRIVCKILQNTGVLLQMCQVFFSMYYLERKKNKKNNDL